eukprot:TRINITY_DN6215_c0_g1_i1.p1 TRINITY_DN6215_c0_g1~~TRINITY_DN6215_c0_g1_i1.p1  ORF type:complete len:167 (-),score=21.64 TRINITY_DN6215_c0_g1_i1:656-1156(-)
MESVRIVRPSGAELVLELAEGSTVLDAKKSIEATTGVHVVEQKLLADAEVLENDQRLDSVIGLASSLTLVHDPPVPWCWPCREVSEPTGTHKLLLYEDPKVTEEDVLYPSPWDDEFDDSTTSLLQSSSVLVITSRTALICGRMMDVPSCQRVASSCYNLPSNRKVV